MSCRLGECRRLWFSSNHGRLANLLAIDHDRFGEFKQRRAQEFVWRESADLWDHWLERARMHLSGRLHFEVPLGDIPDLAEPAVREASFLWAKTAPALARRGCSLDLQAFR